MKEGVHSVIRERQQITENSKNGIDRERRIVENREITSGFQFEGEDEEEEEEEDEEERGKVKARREGERNQIPFRI